MDWSRIKTIGIFRALQLGDLLCSIPAIRALKTFVPEARISLIGLPGSAPVVKRFGMYLDELIVFPGYPGLPEQEYDIKVIPAFIQEMQLRKFDLILQMQGNGTLVNQMIELLGAEDSGGFYTPDDYKPPGELFMPYPDFGHEIDRHLRLMKHIGICECSNLLEFPIYDTDLEAYEKLNLGVYKGQYICIHPGSRDEIRQWPRINFARIADLCIKRGFDVVLTGTSEELEIVNEVAALMTGKPVIAAGKTDLGTMAVLLSEAYALISNCTGISHMAAALNVPGIIISMDGEPGRWAPLDRDILYTYNWLKDMDYKKIEKLLDILIHYGSFRHE